MRSKDVPELDEQAILSVLEDFTGDFHQTPPMVSAIKKMASLCISWLGRVKKLKESLGWCMFMTMN